MEANYLVYVLFFCFSEEAVLLELEPTTNATIQRGEHAIAYRRDNHITYVNLVCSKGDRTCEQNIAALQCFTAITTTSYTHPRRFFPCCAAKRNKPQASQFHLLGGFYLFVAEILY